MHAESRFEDWQDFLDNASLGVHLVDAGGKILWANKLELELLGYAPHEYIGRQFAEFHVDRAELDHILAALAGAGQLLSYPARLRAKDGSVKHVLINSNVFRRDGRFVHTRCFTTCISEAVYAQLKRELARGPRSTGEPST
ncbi:PAS domain S-box protein [Sorangium cellulosum]|uniref:PAS domain S-box protein n=1 Tax=Sorangium cellulosum TaxID=56 RepID=A0A150P709_SORCE|nr:PAS domain-containing protein [Sorangium cellulosum]KYF51465.1 PAS domain S-box protein [Sorangium cellulosum]